MERIANKVKNYLPLRQVKFLCCMAKCTASAIDLQKVGLEIEDGVETQDLKKNGSKPYVKSEKINRLCKIFGKQIMIVNQFVYKPLDETDLENCDEKKWQNDLFVSIFYQLPMDFFMY